MLAEQPLPRMLLPGTVVRVGAQTGLELDDVAAQSETGGIVVCQAKAGLGLGSAPDSALAEALDQALAQYLVGIPGGGGRRPRRGTDVLAIVTDMTAPAIVWRDLAAAISRTGSQPPGTPLDWQLTNKQRAAQEVAIGHLRRLWAQRGEHPSDEDLRELFSVLCVLALDTVDGGSDRAAALAMLRGLVPAGDESAAWRPLVAAGHRAAELREWRDRRTLVAELARDRVAVGPGPSIAGDIATLRSVTASNLAMLRPHVTVPVAGGIHLRREVEAALSQASPADGGVLVVGDAGSGKTGLVVTLAADRLAAGQEVVVLRAADLASAAAGGVRLTRPLDQVLLDWTGAGAATLVIDALDAARGSEDRARLAGLVAALSDSRWQVIATVRTYDVVFGPTLQAAFTGPALSTDTDRVDQRLQGVRHLRVDDFTDAELTPVTSAGTALAAFLASSTPPLGALLRNPFNLRLAAELLGQGAPLSPAARQRLSHARTRLDLLAAYWMHRVDASADAFARTDLLTRLVQEMLARRQLRTVAAPPAVLATDDPAIAGLLSDNLLAVEPQAGTAARRVVTFSHHILFDYTVMRCVLRDPLEPLRLVTCLDADPALPLVARPSLDLLLDELWELGGDRAEFWQHALALAGSWHLLASLAVAAHLVAAGPSVEDLQPLTAGCTSADAARRAAGYALVGQVIGVVGATVTPDPQVAATAAGLSRLAAALAHDARTTTPRWDCLAATANLLGVLERRRPLTSGAPDARHRAAATVELVDACRSDPPAFEPIAAAAARHLGAAILADQGHAGAVARLLDDPAAMGQWGGRVLTELVEALPPLASVDPALASRLAITVWTFDEPREESVEFLSSPLLPMTQSRRQQAEMARWRLGQVFARLCRAHLATAARVVADITNTSLYPSPDPARERQRWPLAVGQTRGWLTHGEELRFVGGHDAATTMAAALGDGLAEAGGNGREPGTNLEVLVERLHSAPAWASILTADTNRNALAAAVLPALETGALLAHPDTQQAAGRLLAVLAAQADAAQHNRLEAAVVAAGDRAEAAGLHKDRVVDALLGCLNAERITDGRLVARLKALASRGGPPALAAPPNVEMLWEGRYTLRDHLEESGEALHTALADAAAALDEDLAAIQNTPANQQTEARTRLPERFLAADAAGAWSATAPRSIRQLLIDAAVMLATDDCTAPTSTIGDRVATVLLQAARAEDAGQPVGTGPGWSRGLRDEAARGIVQLLNRAAWRSSNFAQGLRTTLRALPTDANPVVRMQAAHGLLLTTFEPPDPAATVSLVRGQLLVERDPLVLHVLLRLLLPVTVHAPDAVDQLLREFSAQPQGGFLVNPSAETDPDSDGGTRWAGRDEIAGLLAWMLVVLAVQARTPFACERLAAWFNAPLADLDRTQTLLHHLSLFLNPVGGRGQEAAFDLLSTATDAITSAWQAAVAAPGTASTAPEEPSMAKAATAARIAHHIGQELFLASGAFDERSGTGRQPAPRGELATFAGHAIPILRALGAIQHAQVIQPVVETLIHLHPVNPRAVLLAVAQAVPERSRYVTDPLAAGVVMPYLTRLLAEHRDLVLGDQEGITAFRHLLQAFADAGHAEALAMAYSFSDVFR